MKHDLAQAFGRRAWIVSGQRRNLNFYVWRRAEQLQALPPSQHSVVVPIDRAAAVVYDEGLIGEIAREPRDLFGLIGVGASTRGVGRGGKRGRRHRGKPLHLQYPP